MLSFHCLRWYLRKPRSARPWVTCHGVVDALARVRLQGPLPGGAAACEVEVIAHALADVPQPEDLILVLNTASILAQAGSADAASADLLAGLALKAQRKFTQACELLERASFRLLQKAGVTYGGPAASTPGSSLSIRPSSTTVSVHPRPEVTEAVKAQVLRAACLIEGAASEDAKPRALRGILKE